MKMPIENNSKATAIGPFAQNSRRALHTGPNASPSLNSLRGSIAVALLALIMVGCSGTWIMYDTTQRDRVYFTVGGTTLVSSFALMDEDQMEYVVQAHILGTPKDVDRTCKLEKVPALDNETLKVGDDEQKVYTARQGTDYEFGELVIPAGSVDGTLKLTLKRTEEMNGRYMKIDLRVVEDEEFLAMDPDSSVTKAIITPEFVLYVTDGEPACPEWWITAANGVDYQWGAYYGKFTPAKFRRLLGYYHDIEDKNPSLYADLVEKYGVNLDKEGIQRNFMSFQDQSVWATYVLIPLHAYYVEYYSTHPDEAENFGLTGDLTTFTWGDPMRLLR